MPRVYLDTAPLIYLAESPPPLRDRVAVQLTQWVETGAVLGTSTLTLLELLVVPKREGNVSLQRQYRALLTALLSEPLIELTSSIAELAAEYRARHGWRTPDTIQIASAVHQGYELFYTNDRGLAACPDIRVMLVGPA